MSGVLKNVRAKTTGWLCMCEQNSAKNLIYIRGMHQVNYKRIQIKSLAVLSFSSLSLLLSLLHNPSQLCTIHMAGTMWNLRTGGNLCSLSLALSDESTAVIFYLILHTELYYRSGEIVDVHCGL